MSMSPITSIAPIGEMESLQQTANQTNFMEFVKNEISATETKIQEADKQVQALALGETDNLHQVMLSISKAETGFDLVMEVRNKLLEGYKSVMRMKI